MHVEDLPEWQRQMHDEARERALAKIRRLKAERSENAKRAAATRQRNRAAQERAIWQATTDAVAGDTR
jgi:hypothetical protein